MSDLFNLPVVLVAEIFADWLSLFLLVALDSASCSKGSRKALTEAMVSSEFCLREATLRDPAARWFAKRRMKVKMATVCVMLGVGGETLLTFLRMSGARLELLTITGDLYIISYPSEGGQLEFSLPRLEKLTIKNCGLVDGRSLGALLSICCRTLRCLSVVQCDWNVPLPELKFPNLHTLVIEQCIVDTSGLSRLIAGCPNLRSIHCDNFYRSNACLEALALHCPLLQVLRYEQGSPYSTASLEHVLQACPLIQLVDIGSDAYDDWGCIHDDQIATIMQHCQNLKAFRAPGHSEYVSDVATLAIASRLLDLRHLSLYDCEYASDAPILALAETCSSLVSLELQRLTPYTSQSALVTLVSNLKSIAELRIFDSELSDAVLTAIGGNSPSLRTLHLTNVDGYTEVGVAALLQGCRALGNVLVVDYDEVMTLVYRRLWWAVRPGMAFVRDIEYGHIWESRHLFETGSWTGL